NALKLSIAPPNPWLLPKLPGTLPARARLSVKVQPLTVATPSTVRAPPWALALIPSVPATPNAWLLMKLQLVRVRLPSSSIAPPSATPLPGPKPSKTMNGFVVPFTEPMAWLPMNVVPLMMAVAGTPGPPASAAHDRGPVVAEHVVRDVDGGAGLV